MTTTEEPTKKVVRKKKPEAPADWGSPDRLKGAKNDFKEAKKVWYWCGTYPTCPTAYVHVGAATFSAVTITKQMSARDNQIDTPTVGSLMLLSKHEVMAIAEGIARSVIVFHQTADDEGLEITTSGTDMLHQQRRRGIIVRKKTQEEVDTIINNNGPDMTFTPSELDEPLGDHLWMIPCSDQDHPRAEANDIHGLQPVSVTGIEWPD